MERLACGSSVGSGTPGRQATQEKRNSSSPAHGRTSRPTPIQRRSRCTDPNTLAHYCLHHHRFRRASMAVPADGARGGCGAGSAVFLEYAVIRLPSPLGIVPCRLRGPQKPTSDGSLSHRCCRLENNSKKWSLIHAYELTNCEWFAIKQRSVGRTREMGVTAQS
jgi:hypothetical protein